jgi:hypothetical protein
MSEVNKHAEIIANTVYHVYPYRVGFPTGGFDPKTPHADDCGGCLINAEVKKLVDKLNTLSPVEEIIAELKEAKNTIKTLVEDISKAFEIAGLTEESSVTSLVETLVWEQNRLTRLLEGVKQDLNITIKKLRE